jgi:hypothetical protein
MTGARQKDKKSRKKKERNKVKRLQRQAENIKKKQAEKETFKLEDEIRRITNSELTYKKPKEEKEGQNE